MAIKRRIRPMPARTEKVCPICQRHHRRLGALCGTHEARLRHSGSPTGLAVKHHELDKYRMIVEPLFFKYEAHPAIVAAHGLMKDILENYGVDCDHATVGRKARPFLDRLLQIGATPRSALIECAALAFYWRMEFRDVSAAQMDMAYAHRLLLHKSSGTRGNNRTAWTRRVVGGLGYRIRGDLGALFFQMHSVYAKAADAHDEQRRAASKFTG